MPNRRNFASGALDPRMTMILSVSRHADVRELGEWIATLHVRPQLIANIGSRHPQSEF